MNSVKASVLLADDDTHLIQILMHHIETMGFKVIPCLDRASMMGALEKEVPDVILLDLRFGQHNGEEILKEQLTQCPDQAIIIFTSHATIDSAVNAIKLGAFDYLVKPLDMTRLKVSLDHAVEKKRLSHRLAQLENLVVEEQSRPLWGTSQALVKVREALSAVGPTPATVLIHGESGTGKEIAARLLHQASGRQGPFVPVNMAALPRELVESTLFGHEKGAFTGADRAQQGCCEMADKGTLFLDEIGEMDLSLQAKLLRFLQDFIVQRVGSTKSKTVDVRVVAATNQSLGEKVKQGLFREDLYYRLHVVPVLMPSLRERPGDIPLLANRFLHRFALRYKKESKEFSPQAMEALCAYSWPGNVRQLENLVERMVILSQGPTLELTQLPSEVFLKGEKVASLGEPHHSDELTPLETVEKQAIVESLVRCRGNVKEAARFLGLGQATVYRKIKRYSIVMNDLGRLPAI